MTIAKYMAQSIERSSWIRKMFEEGNKLAQIHGRQNVFDFTLGNPNVPPPDEFHDTLLAHADTKGKDLHGYMPNAGHVHVREAVAARFASEQGHPITAAEIIMTCGAAGALNVIFKAILDPGDVVLCPRPYFVEYGFYVENHQGKLATVSTKPDFTLDLDAFAAALTPEVKAVLINSPNNPTGQVYDKRSLDALGELLRKKSKEYGRTIYLLADEPYRRIVFDGLTVPCPFDSYDDCLIATSWSKELSLPGERIGYIACSPAAQYKKQLMDAMTLANRVLGFVNAPALMQRVVAQLTGVSVDSAHYDRKRDLLCSGLAEAGYEFVKPKGAFYLFCKSPLEDEVAFVNALQEERILTVPGRGFGGPGYFRIAFCVSDDTITRAMPGFKRTIEKVKKK
ncbi:MAG: pyridoxal phosphate-dependent aminotransferase [Thermodesulfobacteriota bacterium]